MKFNRQRLAAVGVFKQLNMKLTKNTTVDEFSLMLTMAGEKEKSKLIAALDNISYNGRIGDTVTCTDLSGITYGQRIKLSEINDKNVLLLPVEVLIGQSPEWVIKQKIAELYPFCRMVVKELERIAKRDEKTFRYTPTADENKAGIDRLNFGFFGVLDKIAKRMSVSHAEVEKMPELRVYAMLKIDFETAQYESRLHKQITDKNKLKK